MVLRNTMRRGRARARGRSRSRRRNCKTCDKRVRKIRMTKRVYNGGDGDSFGFSKYYYYFNNEYYDSIEEILQKSNTDTNTDTNHYYEITITDTKNNFFFKNYVKLILIIFKKTLNKKGIIYITYAKGNYTDIVNHITTYYSKPLSQRLKNIDDPIYFIISKNNNFSNFSFFKNYELNNFFKFDINLNKKTEFNQNNDPNYNEYNLFINNNNLEFKEILQHLYNMSFLKSNYNSIGLTHGYIYEDKTDLEEI
jgi:hypothetical protein